MIGAENQQERLSWFLNQQSEQFAWLRDIPESIGYYLAGFVDGEGSFIVSLRKKSDSLRGWQVDLVFNVAQRDVANLELLKRYLGCGRIQKRSDGIHYFIVGDRHSLKNRVLPFFERFGFLSSTKQRNFSIFKDICELVFAGRQRNRKGFAQIVLMREELNAGRGRTRKYHIGNVLSENTKESSETTRQTRTQ